MKLTITREQLQEGLVAVAASVPAKTTLPILSNILLEATKDGIRLSGTDLKKIAGGSDPVCYSRLCSECTGWYCYTG